MNPPTSMMMPSMHTMPQNPYGNNYGGMNPPFQTPYPQKAALQQSIVGSMAQPTTMGRDPKRSIKDMINNKRNRSMASAGGAFPGAYGNVSSYPTNHNTAIQRNPEMYNTMQATRQNMGAPMMQRGQAG